MNILRRFIIHSGGVSAVEFALAAPLLIMMMAGIATGWTYATQTLQMRSAIKTGANYVLQGGADLTKARSAVLTAWANKPDDGTVQVVRQCSCAGTVSACTSVCTGTGAILLALLSELPSAKGIGTDISEAALQTAAANAARAGLSDRATFIACDYASGLYGPFDLIVSNPPYIRSAEIGGLAVEVRNHDPMAALDGGADGLDAYRALVPQAARLLAPGAALVVEAGAGQSGQIEALMVAAGLTPAPSPKADLAGIPRAVAGHKTAR